MVQTYIQKYYSKIPDWQKEFLRDFRDSHSQKSLDVNGVTWRYYDSEKGQDALLLLHGGFVAFDMWIHQIAAFEGHYRIIAPTCPALSEPTMQRYSDALHAILQNEGLHQINLMGYSEGGLIAQCFLRDHPELIRKAVLAHTFYPSSENKYAQYNFTIFRKMPAFLTEWIFRQFAHPDKEELQHDSTEWLEWYQSYFKENLSDLSKDLILTHIDLMMDFSRNYDFQPGDLSDWDGEMLITVSADDVVLRYFEGLKALYPDAETYMFPKGLGAHSIALITPQVFNERIRAFLKG